MVQPPSGAIELAGKGEMSTVLVKAYDRRVQPPA